MASFSRINQPECLKSTTPSIKPANEEKTTLTANRALVISKKSIVMALGENVFAVAFNACRFVYFKTVAKVLYQKGFDKKTIHKISVGLLPYAN